MSPSSPIQTVLYLFVFSPRPSSQPSFFSHSFYDHEYSDEQPSIPAGSIQSLRRSPYPFRSVSGEDGECRTSHVKLCRVEGVTTSRRVPMGSYRTRVFDFRDMHSDIPISYFLGTAACSTKMPSIAAHSFILLDIHMQSTRLVSQVMR